MHQADNFEVAGVWKIHGIRLPVPQPVRGHTGGAIDAGLIRRRPWTAYCRRRLHLARFEERHGMILTRGKAPRHAGSDMNTKLTGQDRLDLYCPRKTLDSCDR